MEVKVTGIRETLAALRKVDADLEKQIRKSINDSIREVVLTARGFVPADPPMSGWKPGSWRGGWERRAVLSGLKRQNGSQRNFRGGWNYSISVENQSAAGMIYEVAGTKSDGVDTSHGFRGERFIRNIERTGLRRPLHRLVVRAGIQQGPATKERILIALRIAQAVTQGRLDRPHG